MSRAVEIPGSTIRPIEKERLTEIRTPQTSLAAHRLEMLHNREIRSVGVRMQDARISRAEALISSRDDKDRLRERWASAGQGLQVVAAINADKLLPQEHVINLTVADRRTGPRPPIDLQVLRRIAALRAVVPANRRETVGEPSTPARAVARRVKASAARRADPVVRAGLGARPVRQAAEHRAAVVGRAVAEVVPHVAAVAHVEVVVDVEAVVVDPDTVGRCIDEIL